MKFPTLAACLILFVSFSAAAQDITIVTEDWPPYNYDQDGVVAGVVTDILKAALNRTGLDYALEVFPWARAYKMAMEEENVLIYSIFKLKNREKQFKWILVPGLSVEMYLYKPSHRNDIHVKTLEDVKQYTVGVTRDTSTHHFLLNMGFEENVNLISLASEEQNILMTLPEVRRTDFATGDKLSLARWLKLMDMPNDYLTEQLFLFKEDIYFAFGMKTSDETVQKVRDAVEAISQDGTVEHILKEHYKDLGIFLD